MLTSQSGHLPSQFSPSTENLFDDDSSSTKPPEVARLGGLRNEEVRFDTLVDLLSYRSQEQGNCDAYTFLKGGTESGKLTYRELHWQARAIAVRLQSLIIQGRGSVVGERALLLYQPGLEFIAAFMGCLYAGVVAVPAYPPRRNQSLARLQAIVADAEASIVLTTTELLNTFQTRADELLNLSGLHWVTTNNLSQETESDWQSLEISSDTLAFLQYTSGSTGDPKGVMVNHGNLLYNSAVIHHCFEHHTESRGLIWLPPYHDMGLIGGVLQPLYGGFPVTLMAPVDFLQKPLRWLQAIATHRATTSGGPNFAYDLCCRKVTPEQIETLDLSSWEVAFTGAEPVRSETLERFAETFAPCGFRREAFYPCYGMAEATLIITGGLKADPPLVCRVEGTALEQNHVVEVDAQEDARTIVGCGHALLDHTIAIVNPDSLTPCSPGEVGEIWVSGSSVAQGYWNRTEETEKAFQAYLADAQTGPFLRTGDLGFLRNRELFITGRIKDVIIIRGQNHYPQDIELTVEKSHPSLRSGCGAAFSVDFKGVERLVIVQEVERSYLRKLNVKEVVNSIRQAVVAQHGLEVFSAVLVKTGSIPKTSSGKIRRRTCRAEYLAGALEVIQDWSENPQGTTKFLTLQAEIESMLSSLQVNKQGLD